MKVLVIDDLKRNIVSARELLSKDNRIAEVVAVDNIKDACDILHSKAIKEYDALLTDLYLPLGGFTGNMILGKSPRPESGIPAGLVFALRAVQENIPVVICTNANPYTDWLCASMDILYMSMLNNKQVSYVNARYAFSAQYLWDVTKEKLIKFDRNKYIGSRDDTVITIDNGKFIPYIPGSLLKIKDWIRAMSLNSMFENFGF